VVGAAVGPLVGTGLGDGGATGVPVDAPGVPVARTAVGVWAAGVPLVGVAPPGVVVGVALPAGAMPGWKGEGSASVQPPLVAPSNGTLLTVMTGAHQLATCREVIRQ